MTIKWIRSYNMKILFAFFGLLLIPLTALTYAYEEPQNTNQNPINKQQQILQRICTNTAASYSDAYWQSLSLNERYNKTFQWFKKDVLNSNSALSLCCKDGVACKTYLKSTYLILDNDETVAEMLAEYKFSSKSIRISSTLLGNCKHFECVQEVLLHELGHTCQAAIFETDSFFSKIPNKFMQALFVTGQGLLTSGTAGFDRVLSKKQLSCVAESLNKLGSLATQYGEKYSQESWFREAYADIVFAPLKPTPLHWTKSCQSESSYGHAERTAYLHCAF